MELEAGGRVFLEQSDAVTTVLVTTAKLLKTRPDLAEKFRVAHVELTAWLKAEPAAAQALVRAALTAEAKRDIPATLVARAWGRLRFTDRMARAQFDRLVTEAQTVGFLRNAIPLDRMFAAKP